MSLKLKPYQEYKSTKLSWLEEIPAHWTMVRTKHLFRLCTEKAPADHGLDLLSIYTHIGVKPRKDLEERGNKASSTDEYWIVKRGDIIVNKLLAWMGAVGVSHYEGVTSPAYDILRRIGTLNPDFYHYLFRTGLYLREFKSRSRGIMDMRLRLYFDQFGQIPLVSPPLPEQDAIVSFLKDFEHLINRLIRAKRRMIKLLNEQKQVMIHRAVIRGLDPNVRLKHSGIEWLGDVPEHWALIPLKYLCYRVQNGATPPTTERSYYDDGSVPWFGPSSVGRDIEIGEPVRFLNLKAFADGKARKISSPAIMVVVIGATCGRTALLKSDGSSNQQITAFELRPGRVEPLFVAYQLKLAEKVLRSTASTATIPIIDGGKLARFPAIVPPLDEQRQIMTYLVPQLIPFQKNIDRVYQEIELLREYRTRFIADVVTGKLDVRGVEFFALEDIETLEDLEPLDEPEAEQVDDTEEMVDDNY